MAGARRKILIPYAPRALQQVVHDGMDAHRFGVVVCHRRFGKSVLGVNHLQKGAVTCPRLRPRFAYIGPTYRQAKATVWDYLKFYARPIPGVGFHESELRADYPNGGQVRLYGGDDPDSLRGLYFDGVVVDEYGLHAADIFSTVLRPALTDREGWCLILGTPNGRNQFSEIHDYAQAQAGWFSAVYKASETGILTAEELAEARKVMTADEYAQEFECSFSAAVKGAIYGTELERIRSAGQVTRVPYDPVLPVDTDWDLGIGDAMAVWFSQSLKSGEVRLIDYHETSGEGFPQLAAVLQAKGYTYGQHWAPHDIAVRELGSGKSRLEMAAGFGLKFQITPRVNSRTGHEVEEGIHAARMLLPRCWFDTDKTKAGVEALMHYRRDYNQRLNEFKATPVHDWASHGADAFRGLAVRHQTPKDKKPVLSPPRPSYGGSGAWMS
jgi:phage terminase large subunit